jgi:competence protein ComEC
MVFAKRYIFALIFALGLFFLSVSGFQNQEIKLVKQNESISTKKVKIVGFVSDVPTFSEFGQTIPFTITSVDEQTEEAKIKLYARPFPALEYGQIIKFEAEIKPYGNKKWRLIKDGYVGEANLNDYEEVGFQRGIIITLKGWLFDLREKFNKAISRSLPAAEGGLASGLILGEKALLTPEVSRQLQISGTTHIIALSGYNITIIIGLFIYFEKRWTRLARLLVPVLFIFAFVVMTGGSASLIRAAIMGFMPLLAASMGREGDGFIAIMFSAALMIVFNPFLALFDVGFQLSFAALAGMIYLAPIISRFLSGFPSYVSGPLSETTGAQLSAMPLLAYYFGSVSLISPIANLAILSLVPLGMIVAFAIGLAGIFWQGLANLLAIPGFAVLHLINWLIALFGSLPEVSKSVKIENPVWILLLYFLLFGLWLIFSKKNLLVQEEVK